jgi:hypothetical protein
VVIVAAVLGASENQCIKTLNHPRR